MTELLEPRELLTTLDIHADPYFATEEDHLAYEDYLESVNSSTEQQPAEDNYIPGWGWPQPGGLGTAVTVTYSYSNLLDGTLGLSETYLRSAVEEALGLWATYAPLHFVEVEDSGPAPSDVGYSAGNHPQIRIGHHDVTSSSGGNVLAHAYYAWDQSYGLSGDVHFDNKDNWTDGPFGGFDFLEVAVHELGHSLSIMHEESGPPAIMNPFYGARYTGLGSSFLFQDDINAIQGMYGAGVGSVTTLGNNAPHIDPIADQSVSHSVDSFTVDISATDHEGDPITYGATIVPQGGTDLGTVSLNGTTLTIDPADGYIGTYQVMVTADDGEKTGSRTFNVTVTNAAPVLTVGDQTMSPLDDTLVVTLTAGDADNDPLTLGASILASVESQAHQYDVDYGLYANQTDIDNNYWLNLFGQNEKHFRGTSDTYYILSNGDLYEFNGSMAASSYIGTLDATYYADPSKLYNAVPVVDPAITVNLNGDQLTLDPPNGYTGTFTVAVTIDDGFVTTTQNFSVQVVNQSPVIDPVNDQTMPHTTDTIAVSLSATDPEGQAITYSASIVPQIGVTIGTVSVNGNTLTIDPDVTYAGTFQVIASADDGNSTDSTTFNVTVTNNAPTVTPISDQTLSPNGGALTFDILANDLDGDALIYSATAASVESDPAYDLDQQYNLYATQNDVNNNYWQNLFGAGEKNIRGDGGSYFILANGDVYQFNGSIAGSTLLESLDASYYADPSLLYDAPAPAGANMGTSFNGNELTVTPPNGFTGTFEVVVTVSDGIVSVTDTFQITLQNQTPVLDAINDQTMARNTDTINVAMSATDADGDPITYDASIVPQSGVTIGTVSVNGTTLTIDPDADYAGTFQVTVTADDGYQADSLTFQVTVTNNAPTITPINDMAVSPVSGPIVVTVNAADGDGDALSYSATASSTETDVGYDLDQQYNLYATQNDIDNNYWFNIFGAGEKHLRGDGGTYFITADGNFYQFSGSIAASTYLATIDVSYYNDPSLLHDAQAPLGANIPTSFNGNQLTLTPPGGFTGTFAVVVTVSDGAVSTNETFEVTVQNQIPVLTAINDQTMSRSTDSVDINLSGSDPDGDPLTYSASIIPQTGVTIGTVNVNGNTLTVNPDASFEGTFQVTATVSDGYQSDSKTFSVTVTNQAPTITAINDTAMSPSDDTLVMTIDASDADGDALSYSGTAASLVTDPAYDLDQQYNLYATQNDINNNYWFNIFGAGEKNIRGDGGSYFIMANGDFYKFNGSIASSTFLANIETSYYNDPSLLYDAQPPLGSNIPVSFNGNEMTVDPPGGFVGTFQVTVTVSDGAATAVETFLVTIQNQAPVLSAVNDQTMPRSTDSIDVTLSASDDDGDAVTYSAAIVPQSGVTIGTVNVNGNTLTINPDSNYAGIFEVTITATDGFLSDSQTIQVTVTNQTPTFTSIGDQNMLESDGSLVINLDANDADGDALSFSATATATVSDPAWDLKQQYGLYATQADINAGGYLNLFGLGEKHIRGASGSYYLLPNGDFYSLNGSIANSVYLQTVDPAYFNDLSLLYDAQAPVGPVITASVNGNQLTLTPPVGFTGTFDVVVTVSDGAVEVTQTFTVTVSSGMVVSESTAPPASESNSSSDSSDSESGSGDSSNDEVFNSIGDESTLDEV